MAFVNIKTANDLQLEIAKEIRKKRNQLLVESDFMMFPDYPLTENQRAKLIEYRQFLRDMPKQPGFPEDVKFPTLSF